VAIDLQGDFVVAFKGDNPNGSGAAILAQRVSAAGIKQGLPIVVTSKPNSGRPSVAVDGDGDFVVAWEDASEAILARRYDKSGVARGVEFRVSDSSTANAWPAAAMDADGNYVIVWESYAPGSSTGDIYAKTYNAGGKALGTRFRVNTLTSGRQEWPSVAMSLDGRCTVAWASEGRDGSEHGIAARRFTLKVPTAMLSSGKLIVGGTSGNDNVKLTTVDAQIHVDFGGLVEKVANSAVTAVEVKTLDGNDRVTIGSGIIGVSVRGGNGNDTVTGGAGNDSLLGEAGNDELSGSGGGDSLVGGKHADRIVGGEGNDVLAGGDGADTLDAGAGRDILRGDGGNDSIVGGNHNDTLFAGPGRDTVIGGKGSDSADVQDEDTVSLVELIL
jgi:Ca2+-binding RTX toxin-like protein